MRLTFVVVVAATWCALVRAQSLQPSSQPHRQGMLDMLMSPLRSIHNQAHNLFGSSRMDRVDNYVQDKFDQLQARTFNIFMRVYNKTYSPGEIPKRMHLFFERRKEIEKSVRAYAAGKLPFMMRENPYLDWDDQELRALTGVAPPKSVDELAPEEHAVIFGDDQQQQSQGWQKQRRVAHRAPRVTRSLGSQTSVHLINDSMLRELNDEDHFLIDDIDPDTVGHETNSSAIEEPNLIVRAPVRIPAYKDWRRSGCVATPVDQKKCGCCYAIATMGAVESMRCIKQVSSPTLSPQQVIDCSTPRAGYQNFGCEGGWPTRVLRYLQDVGVAAREACYPLVLRQEYCKLNRVKTVSGCTVSPSPSGARLRYKVLTNERDILYHVATTGPVVTVMRATDKFLYYGSGIFDDPSCSRQADDVDHAITIVGYGRENGQDYWIIKNSWGTVWGQGGYGKYRRGTNACSIGHWGWTILD